MRSVKHSSLSWDRKKRLLARVNKANMLIHHHNGRAQKVFITENAMRSWHKKLFQPKVNTKKTFLTWNVKWCLTQKSRITENIKRMITTIKNICLAVFIFTMTLWNFIAAHIADVIGPNKWCGLNDFVKSSRLSKS